jgi:hypothetical protein
VSAASLATLSKTYYTRSDILENVSIQFAAFEAMSSYLELYISVASILPTNFDKSLVLLITRYTSTNPNDPSYPFTSEFLSETTTNEQYTTLRDRYVRGKTDLMTLLVSVISPIVDDLFIKYQSYEKLPDAGKERLALDPRVSRFYATYKDRRSDGIQFILSEANFVSLNLIKQFNSDMALILQDAKYKECLVKDAAGVNEPGFKLNFFQHLN